MISKSMRFITTAAVLASAALAPSVVPAQNPTAGSDCTLPAQKGDRVPSDGEMTNKLDACNGVLKAPEAGDKDIVTPAPDTGSSRIINPTDMPGATSPSTGSGG